MTNKTTPQPLLTVPSAPESIKITPEMIEEILEKQKKEDAKIAAARKNNEIMKTPSLPHIYGQRLIISPTSPLVHKTDDFRYYFEENDGHINVYYGGNYCAALEIPQASGLLTGLVNLILENLPCNKYNEGADESTLKELCNGMHHLTQGMCQLAEWFDDNSSKSIAETAIAENNLYSYELDDQANALTKDWEPFSPMKLEPKKPVMHPTDDEDNVLAKHPIAAIDITELQSKLATLDADKIYGNVTHDLLVDYFGEDYIRSLSISDYYELIDELYVSGLADASAKHRQARALEEEEDDDDDGLPIYDEYMDYHYGSDTNKSQLPYTTSLYSDDDDDDLGECIWYLGCEDTPDDETVIGIYDNTLHRARVCYSNLDGYPVNANEEDRTNAYPVAFMDIVLEAGPFAQALLSEIPNILSNTGLIGEIGPAVRSISAAALYAVLSTDPNVGRYTATTGTFKSIAFGTHTTYVDFRRCIGNIIAQLLGINVAVKNGNSLVSAEVADIMDEIHKGIDRAVYTAYMDFRRNYLTKKYGISNM